MSCRVSEGRGSDCGPHLLYGSGTREIKVGRDPARRFENDFAWIKVYRFRELSQSEGSEGRSSLVERHCELEVAYSVRGERVHGCCETQVVSCVLSDPN
jgi:hypothetical protein